MAEGRRLIFQPHINQIHRQAEAPVISLNPGGPTGEVRSSRKLTGNLPIWLLHFREIGVQGGITIYQLLTQVSGDSVPIYQFLTRILGFHRRLVSSSVSIKFLLERGTVSCRTLPPFSNPPGVSFVLIGCGGGVGSSSDNDSDTTPEMN